MVVSSCELKNTLKSKDIQIESSAIISFELGWFSGYPLRQALCTMLGSSVHMCRICLPYSVRIKGRTGSREGNLPMPQAMGTLFLCGVLFMSHVSFKDAKSFHTSFAVGCDFEQGYGLGRRTLAFPLRAFRSSTEASGFKGRSPFAPFLPP